MRFAVRDHYRDDIDASLDLIIGQTALMDVRAPIEFEHGAIPGAVNVPLLDNDQRAAVGTRYKEASQNAAIELGLELATPAIRAKRLDAWSRFTQQHPNGYLYCYRRSEIQHDSSLVAGRRHSLPAGARRLQGAAPGVDRGV
jgi:tRNA 2-selenouridine synthase